MARRVPIYNCLKYIEYRIRQIGVPTDLGGGGGQKF